ncbi:S1 family peptidase [Lysobacter humi (ex Lee et al. 2017)]
MRHLALLLCLATCTAGAVVIRDDVPDLRYRASAADFPALADIAVEGHGVLIAPRWVVTAAHAVTWQHRVDVVVVNGVPREVAKVILHPGYRKLPQAMIDAALKADDTREVLDFLSKSDDVALIQLAAPVTDVAPVAIHRTPVVGQTIRIIGKGATATGRDGHDPHGPNRTDLRQAFNTLTRSEGRWLAYTFDAPPAALPLEGSAGNGDSGGPVLVDADGRWQLAGLTSWKHVDGKPSAFRPSRYGQLSYAVRLAAYVDWMETTMAAEGN